MSAYGAQLTWDQALALLKRVGVPESKAAAALDEASEKGVSPLRDYQVIVVMPEPGVYKLQDG
jgi:hypothetical protein